MIYHGCSSNARIQPLWNIFLCVYFSPKLHKACVTAQVPSGASSQVKRLSLQANHGNLWRSNYSALTDTNYKLQALKSLHNPYCAYGTSTLSHWDTKIYREDRNKRWQNLHTFPQNINYSVILKIHKQQSGFPQFCGIKVFDSFFWVQQQEIKMSSYQTNFFSFLMWDGCCFNRTATNKTVKQMWKTNSKNSRYWHRTH